MTPDLLATHCTRLYATLTEREPSTDSEYTELIFETVRAATDPAELATYPATLAAFVEVERDALTHLIRTFGPGSSFDTPQSWGAVPYEFVHSPAVIALCERLASKPMLLQAVWREQWESETPMEDLDAAWGNCSGSQI